MEDFENYIKQEYNNYSIANIKYKYNIFIKLDKTTKNPIKQYNIFVNVKFYDNNLKILQSLNLKFINDKLNKTSANKLHNIKSDDLNNKFILAKSDIVDNIRGELTMKIDKFKLKLNEINEYESCNIDNHDKNKDIEKKERNKYDM